MIRRKRKKKKLKKKDRHIKKEPVVVEEEPEIVEEEPSVTDVNLIDVKLATELIESLDGIYSAWIVVEDDWLKAIHLLTDWPVNQAVRKVRTAIYAKTGYLIDNQTIFRVARIEK